MGSTKPDNAATRPDVAVVTNVTKTVVFQPVASGRVVNDNNARCDNALAVVVDNNVVGIILFICQRSAGFLFLFVLINSAGSVKHRGIG